MHIMIQHIAASNGNVECILLLLDFGADPNRKGTLSISIPQRKLHGLFLLENHTLCLENYGYITSLQS